MPVLSSSQLSNRRTVRIKIRAIHHSSQLTNGALSSAFPLPIVNPQTPLPVTPFHTQSHPQIHSPNPQMGKGGGCVPSKKKHPITTTTTARSTLPPPPLDTTTTTTRTSTSSSSDLQNDTVSLPPTTTTTTSLKLYIIFYSMYGHVEGLARRMKKGVDSVPGVEGLLFRAPETLSPEVLAQMKAPPKDDSIPEITSPAELANADGFLFGFPTRYGSMAAQMKAFFDSTGKLWEAQRLAGKPAGFFVSTGTQGGGQETTAWTAITQLAHHGMLFVPIGYTFGAGMFKMDSIRGGSPYGAGVFAGDGTREPTDTELALAEHQGKYMAAVVKRLSHS